MELICAGFCCHLDDALAMAVLSREIAADDADFLKPFRIGYDRRFIETAAHNRESVQLNVIREGAPAVDSDC